MGGTAKTCHFCGQPFNGMSKAGLPDVCKSCRGTCITCRNPKNLDSHKQCTRCRAIKRVCDECGQGFNGNQKSCPSCVSAPQNAKARDRRYNLAPGQFDQMMADQNGLCAICGQPEKSVSSRTGKAYPLAVDHDRSCCPGDGSCGRCVRKLVCRNHNVLLGMAGDNIDLLLAAAAYLRSFAPITTA
jgi:hypothetical protein